MEMTYKLFCLHVLQMRVEEDTVHYVYPPVFARKHSISLSGSHHCACWNGVYCCQCPHSVCTVLSDQWPSLYGDGLTIKRSWVQFPLPGMYRNARQNSYSILPLPTQQWLLDNVTNCGCISLLYPRLRKLPSPFDLHWLGVLGNLGSNNAIQP